VALCTWDVRVAPRSGAELPRPFPSRAGAPFAGRRHVGFSSSVPIQQESAVHGPVPLEKAPDAAERQPARRFTSHGRRAR
jgi:hypothetical protein